MRERGEEETGTIEPECLPIFDVNVVIGPAVQYSEAANRIRSPPPMLGEHTKEVLSNVLNISEEELKHLKENKAIDFAEKKENNI